MPEIFIDFRGSIDAIFLLDYISENENHSCIIQKKDSFIMRTTEDKKAGTVPKKSLSRSLKRCSLFIVAVLAFMICVTCGDTSKDSRYNLVLISLDTVRYDALGYTGKALADTPAIDALSRDGCSFTQAISTNSLTTPAHCSLFTGRYPTAHGVHNIGLQSLSQTEKTLAESLKESGYQTAAFVAAFPVSHRFGLAKGFDIYDDRIAVSDHEQETKSRMADIFAERSAGDVADLAITWLNERRSGEDPFFLFLHFFDPHFPYDPPPEFIQRYGTTTKQRYAGEIAYTDSQLRRFLSALERKNSPDRTIIIAFSDHGESLGEHGEDGHGIFIYDSTIRIPLIFRGGPVAQGKSFDDQVSIIDIFPTIVDLLGLPIPKDLHGRSLKALLLGTAEGLEEHQYYIESFVGHDSFGWAPLIGMRTPFAKLIRAPRPELYDHLEDPLEERNLYQVNPGHAQELEDAFTALLRGITQESDETSAQLSGRELDLLHSLGYIGAGIKSAQLGEMPDPKDRIDLYRRLKDARSKLLNNIDIENVLEEFKTLEKEDPSNMTLRLLVGKTLQTLDRTDEAESYYRSLIEEYPEFTLSLNELAALLSKKQDWQDAATFYQKSLELDPTQIELYPNLAFALLKMDRMDESISLIDGALARYPKEPSLHGIRGELAYQTKDYDAALRHFSLAHAEDRGDLEAARNHAKALLASGKAARGVEILRPLASQGENDIEFLLMYGQCLAQAGRFQEGMECFQKVLRMEERPSAHYFMGLCLLKSGKIEDAKKHFSHLDRNDPNYEMSLRALESCDAQ